MLQEYAPEARSSVRQSMASRYVSRLYRNPRAGGDDFYRARVIVSRRNGAVYVFPFSIRLYRVSGLEGGCDLFRDVTQSGAALALNSNVRTPMMEQAISDHLALRQCALQWRGMLRAFAAVVAQEVEAGAMRDLLYAVGMRFAEDHSLPAAPTLAEIQNHMNAYWLALDWGWVELNEAATHVTVAHRCAPLAAAFGEEGAPWAGALLEGVYTQWFRAMGAGDQLRVRQASPLDAYGNAEFHLSQ